MCILSWHLMVIKIQVGNTFLQNFEVISLLLFNSHFKVWIHSDSYSFLRDLFSFWKLIRIFSVSSILKYYEDMPWKALEHLLDNLFFFVGTSLICQMLNLLDWFPSFLNLSYFLPLPFCFLFWEISTTFYFNITLKKFIALKYFFFVVLFIAS